MAAFHFTAKIHSRAKGASAVRAAAYRSASRLLDERAGKAEDYSRKADVIETAILAPADAPAWVREREALWNRVEAREQRRDAQLCQELELNLPRGLSETENWRLVTDFAHRHLVAEGRICDIAMHVGEASDGAQHPHAHILMPLRQLAGDALGEKHPDCDWRTFTKRRDRLGELREAWCDFARQRALELGHDLGEGWDHRSFEARGLDLEAQPKHGATAQRLERAGQAAERTQEVLDALRRNGAQLLVDPGIALKAITQRQSTFTDIELARWIHRHSAEDQFAQILAGARERAIEVGRDDRGQARYSTKGMIALEAGMVDDARALEARHGHAVAAKGQHRIFARLSAEQAAAADYLLDQGDLACLVGYAGAGKSTLLGEARAAWEAQGYRVRGAALSGIATENLTNGSGISDARTIASLEYAWERGRDQLTAGDVLVIDEAGMVGSRGLSRLVSAAKEAGAKIVLIGDPEQLQAIEAGAAFRGITERVGAAELTEVRRQREEWQREATRALATGKTAEALRRYAEAGCIEARSNDADARLHLVETWLADRQARPEATRIMLAHENDDVRQLNDVARDLLRADGQLGLAEVELETNFGRRGFTAGDRLIFRRNDRELGVRNGTLGTVAEIEPGRLEVRCDDGRQVSLNPLDYKDLDHGYATTVHRAQGVTVDEAHVLATRGFDRHLAYVACSRHRDRLTIVHSRETFANDVRLAGVLGRERAKDLTLDYREEGPPRLPAGAVTSQIKASKLEPAPRPTQAFIDAQQPPRTFAEAQRQAQAHAAERQREPDRQSAPTPQRPAVPDAPKPPARTFEEATREAYRYAARNRQDRERER